MCTVLVIGVGDMGERLAAGLAGHPRVRRLLLAGRSRAAMAAVDATRVADVASLLGSRGPDLVVQCAAARGPWDLRGREDPPARAVAAAGLALRLPYQLAVPLAGMRAARRVGYAGPGVN